MKEWWIYFHGSSTFLLCPFTISEVFRHNGLIQRSLIRPGLMGLWTQYDHHVQDRSFQVGDTVWLSILIVGKLESRWQGGGRSNPSRDPPPRWLMMAEHHRLYTSTDYNAESKPNSEHHSTVPTSRIMGLCPGHPLLLSMKRWCLKNLRHNHSIQSGITDLLTDYNSSLGQAPSGWGRYNTGMLDCIVMFQCIYSLCVFNYAWM